MLNRIVEYEGGSLDDKECKIEIRVRSEIAVAVVDWETKCTVGFVARVFVALVGADSLDQTFVRLLRLKGESEFDAERKESYRNGGVGVAQVVGQRFI